jgi:aspartyl-tRNA(Asn)/glutamyl-tRNA(Gln) amidotransferase subunit A
MNIDSLSLIDKRDLMKSREVNASDLAAPVTGKSSGSTRRLMPSSPSFHPNKTYQTTAASPVWNPLAVKDLYDTKGIRTTGGSKFFADHVPSEDASWCKNQKSGSAQVIGKTNTHEIALGVTNNNPHFGACRNPWDVTRTPGGSSGGSAVAVATGMALAALGTDTGGSIRIPASLCGVVGFKPTYGRVSLRGILPLSWNLDHAGPITRKVEDAALMLQVMGGYDEQDPTSVKTLPGDYSSHLRDQ